MTIGLDDTVVTSIWPVAFRKLVTVVTCLSEILEIIEDLFKPVPAAGAPAFSAMNTSSVSGCQTTASWKVGFVPELAMSVSVGLLPITDRNSSS